MKKILLCALAVFSLSLTSCNNQKDPEKVAQDFVEALQKSDAENMAKLMYGYEEASEENREEGIKRLQEKISSLDQDEKEFLENMTIEDINVKEEEERAKVTLKYQDAEETLRLRKENGNWVIVDF